MRSFRPSSILLIILGLTVLPISAETLSRSGIHLRLDSSTPWSDAESVEVIWEQGADEVSISLKAPAEVEALLPGGVLLRGGEDHEFGPVSPGENWLVDLHGLNEGEEVLLVAERVVAEQRFQSLLHFKLQDGRIVHQEIREYLIRPAATDDFAWKDRISESQVEPGSVSGRSGSGALVIESLNPKIAATAFAEDAVHYSIPDGPTACGDTDHTWGVNDMFHIESAPAGATSTAITVHVEITHPRMADLQVGFGRSDNPYSWYLNYLLKNDAGVNLNQDFTQDRYGHNFAALGDGVNGYYILSIRDCLAADTGTLTYFSVLIEYDTPTSIDLLADTVQVTPDPVAPGDNATVNWSGHVEGTGTVSGAFNTNLYLSTDTNITTADTWLATINVASATNPGDTFGESAPGHTVSIPGGLSDGTYYIGAIVDSGNTIAESNEGNNVAWDGFQVQAAADEYDLVADSLTPQAASVQAGHTLAVNWFGHLAGTSTGTLSTAFTVGFYLSGDASITTGDTLLNRTTIAGPLNPGASIGTSGLNLSIPGSTTAGNYYLGMIVDDTGAVSETNENNNISSSAVAVTGGGGGGQADLTASNCALGAGSGEVGDVINISWLGRNIGSADAPSFPAVAYLSRDTTLDGGADTQIKSRTLGPWSAGQSENVSWNFTIPAGTGSGSWYVIVQVDSTNQVSESNENNNSCYAPLSVSGGSGGGVTRWLLPAAASAPGFGSSNWKTQIAVSNPTSATRQASMYYVPDGWAWPGVLLSGPTNISPHSNWYLDDVLATMNPTAGLLYVVLDAAGPVVTSRTYNLQNDGSTFGQGIPAIALDSGSVPTDFIIPMVHSGGGRFHTNLGIVQASSGVLTVRLDFYTASGLLLTSATRTVSDAWEQINDVFAKVGLGASLVEGGWIQVHLNSGSPDAWTAYGSVVDDLSGDPTFVAGVPLQ